MEKKDKELLLKDLCARLSYGLKYNFGGYDGCDYTMYKVSLNAVDDNFPIEDVKPYLFPLSSMTEEQLHELKEITDFKYNRNNLELVEWAKTHKTIEFWLEEVPQYKVVEVFDWLNKNHFDYRCLIERGLVIDATRLNIY